MTVYAPPVTLTPLIVSLATEIGAACARLEIQHEHTLKLRRINRIRTIQGSLAIEGNTLSEEQITAIIAGKRVIAPPEDILEAQNAIACYRELLNWQPAQELHLKAAHQLLMKGLLADAGRYRQGSVGVMSGSTVIHMAPPAERVPHLMKQLLSWLKNTTMPPLIASCVFHYEFEFIHPFADGNGRMGRLWQTLIMSHWNPLFSDIPVESLIHDHQAEYYQAINLSTVKSDSAPFVEFMLQMILSAIKQALPPQVTPHVTPQVTRLLNLMTKEMSREQMQSALALQDRKSFRERYLLPALNAQLIEMTIPEKPQSRFQCYRLTEKGKIMLLQLPDTVR